MIKLEWWNSYNILGVYYEGGYKNRIWLPVDVKKPQYVVTREGFEDSYGETHNTFMKWEKQYQFEFWTTEPMADALSTITMHDNVWVEFENGYSAKCKDFLTDISWEAIDNVAKVVCTFITQSYNVNGSSSSSC